MCIMQAFADSLHIPYMETSAKDLSSVDTAFKSIIYQIRALKQCQNNEGISLWCFVLDNCIAFDIIDNHVGNSEKKVLGSRKLLFVKVPLVCLFAAATIYLISRNFPTRLQRIFNFPKLQRIFTFRT